MSLHTILADTTVVVTVGAGGVGKTSLAASIGLNQALAGRSVMVVTIDPAKRLATALGLKEIGGKPKSIDLSTLGSDAGGRLDIMMLDTSEVFKDMIRANVSNTELQNAILHNRFFKRFTSAMSGTQEHAAVEKLYDLVEAKTYDLIVLDTPPSRHALEFLSAPRRLLNFLDDSVLYWIVKPASTGMTVLSFGSRYIAKMLSFFAGAEMLSDLAEFLSLMASELSNMRDRAEKVGELLLRKDTKFLIVGSPERHGTEGALMFHRALTKDGYHLGGFIMNRVRLPLSHDTSKDELIRRIKALWKNGEPPDALVDYLCKTGQRHRKLAEMQAERIADLAAAAHKEYPLIVVERFVEEIADMHGVKALSDAVFADSKNTD